MFGNQLFKTSRKVSKKQTPATRTRIRIAIHNLPLGDVKKSHERNLFRLRVGDYRVIFDRNGNIL